MSGLYFGISIVDNSVVIGNLIDLAGSKFVFIGEDGIFRLPLIPIDGNTIKKAYE